MQQTDHLSSVRELAQDVSFSAVARWKEETGGKAIGHFPVFAPQEIIRAAGMLPVGVMGAWGLLEVDYADSRVQSFVCSVARTTLELGLTGRLKELDGMVFTDICDVARNLSGVWKRNFPEMLVEYLHLPQNVTSAASVVYLERELERFKGKLEDLSGVKVGEDSLWEGIEVYNHQRELLQRIYRIRRESPWLLPADEAYLLGRAAAQMPVEDHVSLLERSIAEIEARTVKSRDNIRVLLLGPFCEQPPLELLRIVEESGCYVVDDELLQTYRWYTSAVPTNGNPLRSLAESYIERARLSSVRYQVRRRREAIVEWLKEARAEGVLFCSAKFCEPALYDYVLYKEALEAESVPYLHLEFEEKMSAFETVRMQVETFVESILFA
ncbi:MAG: 2-hydroxyacyl-CoA dehydratase [Candidatus Thermoplasmatota archaeon]|nr:2-hydroxyacyl-CoA dehydratase [Candidatus Thermoplasmatota archaeon]